LPASELSGYAEWPKVADAVIKAVYLMHKQVWDLLIIFGA
jgi:hypothetical protein